MMVSLWIFFINFCLQIGQINEFSMQKSAKILELKGLSRRFVVHILFLMKILRATSAWTSCEENRKIGTCKWKQSDSCNCLDAGDEGYSGGEANVSSCLQLEKNQVPRQCAQFIIILHDFLLFKLNRYTCIFYNNNYIARQLKKLQ